MAADLSQYLDIPDALLQEQMPGVDVAAFKEKIRQSQQANAKPVTQTIKTDPTTGEQTMTVSGSVQDLSPSNPLAPTVTPAIQNQAPVAAPIAPVAPTFDRMVQAESGGQQFNPQGGVLTSPRGALGMAQVMPSTAAQPGYGVKPATPEEINTPEGNRAFGQRYYQGLLQHFGGDEQKAIAAYNAGPGRVGQNIQANNGQLNVAQLPQETQDYLRKVQAPVAPVAPGQQPRPLIAGTPSSDVGLTPTEQAIKQQQVVPAWQQTVLNAQGDPTKLAQIMAGDYPADAKTLAQNLIVQNSLDAQQKLDAQKKLQGFAQGDPTAARDVMKLIGKESEEGSYVKAVLFSQLGLHDLSKQEQAKLGGPAISKAMVDGKSYLTESRNGVIVGAYDPTGKRVDDATLARINAESTPQGTHAYGFTGEAAIVPGTNEEVRQRTNAITGKVEYVHVNGPKAGQVYSGAAVPTPKSVSTAAAKMDYGVISAYRKRFGEDALGALAQMQKDRGPMTRQEQDAFLNSYGFQAGPPGVGGVPTQPGAQPAPIMAPGAVPGPVAPGTPQGQAQPQPTVPVARPAVPGQPQTQPQVVVPGTQNAPATNVPGSTPPPVRGATEPETTYKMRVEVWKKEADDLAAGQAKTKLALPLYQSQADQLLTTVNDVVKHPGFESNVGVRSPLGILQLRGTDARNWQSKYSQLMGQEFLDAFSQLKGAGAISDKEGAAATQARAALSDPGISEAEFKRNAAILEDTIKRGVNRQRMLAGQEPDARYFLGDPKKAKEAYEWAKAHPDDPSAPAVLDKIGLR